MTDIRIPEVGDEVDGHVITEVGEVARISSNHSIVPVRVAGGACELLSVSDYGGQGRSVRFWQIENEQARAALNASTELPRASRGGSDAIYFNGRDADGPFQGSLFYNEKSDLADTFTRR